MVKALDKALALLAIMAPTPERSEWKLVELAKQTRLPLSTVHRLLNALAQRRFVERGEGGRYRLGLTLLQLGHAVWENLPLRQIAWPVMADLARRTEDTVYLTMRDGDEGVYVEKIDSQLYLRIAEPVGFRRPLYVGASRKAMLAFLPPGEIRRIVREGASRSLLGRRVTIQALLCELQRIREAGYAITWGETTEGTAGVAAPLIDARGWPIGAISVSGPAQRFPADRLPKLGQHVRDAAEVISGRLGYVKSPRHLPGSTAAR
ncbi:MAG: IclR family transcriptional regulator [Armatimonadota bacterium]|nr:IclR family transcriptional regulator [Armatimonadota bacterium]MDR7487133.1 IclR family transcriptional regulator [Armatimonadota bacterium]MDR7535023.1 IclR family transcriptional regulator [Armatimonadota bacterium]